MTHSTLTAHTTGHLSTDETSFGQGIDRQPPCVSSDARDALDATGYAELKGVGTAFAGGTLHLMGEVSSFFMKQVAQQAVANVPHVAGIKNEIQVTRLNR